MANQSKSGLQALILLVLLSSCSTPPIVEIYKPGTVDPAWLTLQEEQPIQTTQPTPVQDTPTPQPSIPAAVEKRCLESAGKFVNYEIPWDDETLAGRIYLPPCYLETGLRYPTLYLLHGATETDQQWEDLGLKEIADDLITQGELSPLIIVMPQEDTWIKLEENYFGDHLIQVVVPWIDKEYQTLAERQFRAVGGLSRGGNWAIRLGLLHWDMFGSVGGHSAPLFYGDIYRLPAWLEDIPEDNFPRVYLDISEGDKYLAEARILQDILEKGGVSPEWHLYPGLHNAAYWSSHLEEYLLWYNAGWSDLDNKTY